MSDSKKERKLTTEEERRKELAKQGKGEPRHEHRQAGKGKEVYK